MISNLGFEVKLTKDGGVPENWDDTCDDGKSHCLSCYCVLLASKNV